MSPWALGQQMPQPMFDRYNAFPMQTGGYPNASTSGSPMNYGAWYPPTTYAASPAYGVPTSGPAYRGGYPTTTSYSGNQSYNPTTTGPSYNQYGTSGGNQAISSGTHGNTHTATTGASHNTGYDPALLAAMQNMSFGNK